MPTLVGRPIAAVLLCLLCGAVSLAQTHHDLHHDHYRNWVNGEDNGCCNDRDCGRLADDDVRSTAQGLLVFVHGVGVARGLTAWCPVLARHYLKRGNAPNWSTAHICVSDYYGGKTPCEQFICFQPKPLI